MKYLVLMLIVLLALVVSAPANAITVGVSLDVHQDCQIANQQELPNDFHIEGKIESIGVPPVLTSHTDGPFAPPAGTFSYTITKVDPTNPADPWYIFTGDWSFPAGSPGIPYCTMTNFGLIFDVGEKNTIINLIGWWTRDGKKIGDVITGNNFHNKGFVPAVGFNVTEDPIGLGQSIRISSGAQQSAQNPPTIPVEIVAMDLLTLPAGTDISIDALKENGAQLNLEWIHVVDAKGIPIGINNPILLSGLADSFFDVFFEVPVSGHPGVPQGQQFTIPSGGFLVARTLIQFTNNYGLTESKWEWEIHQDPTIMPTLDYGDAPYNPYPTLLANNGARHIIVKDFHLGQFEDAEWNGQPDPNALGDDINPAVGPDDEDGVTFITPLNVGQNALIIVNAAIPASMVGKLDAWIDFNKNGVWDAGEQVYASTALVNGNNTLSFMVPATASTGNTFARFRLSTTGGLTSVGLAQNGEVEDYQVYIKPALQQPILDFGDAPDQPYPTLFTSNGARHIIVNGFHLGQLIEAEWDGQPDTNAMGDDNNNLDDEDGVTVSGMQVGQVASTIVYATIPTGMYGKLDAWIDFNHDGDWTDAGEQIFTNKPLVNGNNNLSFTVLNTALVGPAYARFRLSDSGGLTPLGLAQNGEVEDYQFYIEPGLQLPTLDFGDAPDIAGSIFKYPTLLVNNGARHKMVDKFYLGTRFDTEWDGQQNALATGDDINGVDDEDGVTFLTLLKQGQIAQIKVTATIPATMTGKLDAWIDFNHNGNWTDPGEQIYAGTALVNGNNNLNFMVPATSLVGNTFARFRLSDTGGLTSVGLALNGEVEDYRLYIKQAPLIVFGSVILSDFSAGDITAVPITVEMNGVPVSLYLNADGKFTINDVDAGTYDIRFKASRWLTRTYYGVAISGNIDIGTVTLINGDVINNNEVDFSDINAVRAAYGSFPGDKTWNEMADVDGSGEVDFTDINIVRNNYGEIGY